MKKFDRRNSPLIRVSLDSYTIDHNGKHKEFPLEEKNHKDLIQFLVKVNDKSISKAADHIGKFQQNLFKTLEREKLTFIDFIKIYKFSTGNDFKTGFDFVDNLKGITSLMLWQVVDLLQAEGLPLAVKCGSTYYKFVNTKNK